MTFPDEFVDDLPADPRHAPDDDCVDLGLLLDLPPLTHVGVRLCANALICSLVLAFKLGCTGVRYSRDNNRYGQRRHMHPWWWTRRNVVTAVTHLSNAHAAIAHDQKPPRNPLCDHDTAQQSRLEALAGFFHPEIVAMVEQMARQPLDRVLCRDKNGDALPRRKHRRVAETLAFCEQYDPAVAMLDLRLFHPVVRSERNGTIFVPNKDGKYRRLSLDRRFPTRIFSRNYDNGGRLYRTFWSLMSGELRAALTINGLPVGEYDFSACHLRLAYLAMGYERPVSHRGDYYNLPGNHDFLRDDSKFGTQIMFNGRTKRGAIGAIAGHLQAKHPGTSHKAHLVRAEELYSRIGERHPELASLWGAGVGLVFQLIDSEIICSTLLSLLHDHGVVGLSVHDSVIVQRAHLGALKNLMEATFQDVGERLAPELVDAHLKSGRQRRSTRPRRKPEAQKRRLSQSEQVKARRWAAGGVPSIVRVSLIRPWEQSDMGATAWRAAMSDSIQRQVAAYRVLMLRHDVEALREVDERVKRYRFVRQAGCPSDRLPIDDLLEQLEDIIATARRYDDT